ncbi:GNAT family N-acetyltransferase [Halobacillus sp. Marseille-Q1614]|uniref:GNAT family N-acetyltransferase n=1 Tax=Halobacillus sp. Marseille-Q1614 TaxID=2709134 RepID=UPI00156D7D24|nr:GNAT family N-acetyltransferase [Halobacillus sp. Marseille-Q1614]
MDFSSARIKYLPITLDLAQMIMKNPLAFYYKYQLPWNRQWPHDGLKAMLPFYVEALEENESQLGFGPWIMIEEEAGQIIGDIGFKGRPDEEGRIEIGYHVAENQRNKGFATEAVQALCTWAFHNPVVKRVEAQCDKDNIQSQKVLINNGFHQTEIDRDMFTFQKLKQENKSSTTKHKKEL